MTSTSWLKKRRLKGSLKPLERIWYAFFRHEAAILIHEIPAAQLYMYRHIVYG
jgi:hypothetical protein